MIMSFNSITKYKDLAKAILPQTYREVVFMMQGVRFGLDKSVVSCYSIANSI